MIYPKNFEQKVGFDQIRQLIREKCISDMGAQFVDKIRFSANRGVIEKMLGQAEEFKSILLTAKGFPSNNYFDLRHEITRLKTDGSYIESEALFDLRSSLQTISEILNFFHQSNPDDYPELKELAGRVFLPVEIMNETDRIIDDKGEIKNTASEKLASIRKQFDKKQKQVQHVIKKAFQQAKKSGWVPENAEITIRNGRLVIPVNASDKRAIAGFYHDESSSGQTIFVEPAESFGINNEIRELENEERREIIKILIRFSDHLRPFIHDLLGAYSFLGLMDFIRAKALFALQTEASVPKISSEKTLEIKKARHPLLFLAHQAAGKAVVPLNMVLNPTNRILVISGPNAGGKSVCLKTVGLLQYMLQCGLPVSCSPDSRFSLFNRLFIDIGDEQSLENDLSTYSSHLLNMKFFLRHADKETLFLIDEFGTGTEPQLGGSIAEATLEQLNKKGAFGVVTTHYTNLKLAAQKLEGCVNGAMLFDSKAMQPLYQLQVGNPGSSFAFEIAKTIGFPNYVLSRAKRKSGGKHVSFDKQLQQLEADKIALEKQQKDMLTANEQLSAMTEKYTRLLDEIKQTRKQMILEAKNEALNILTQSNKTVEKTIREIKEVKADKGKTKEIREHLEKKKRNLEKQLGKNETPPPDAPRKISEDEETDENKRLKAGDYVRIKNTDIIGELLNVDGDDAYVDVNDIRLKTSTGKLVKTERMPAKNFVFRSKRSRQHIMNEINEKATHFNLTIDLRGKRVEEALKILKKYIDDAILLSIGEVDILHGKGDGILRPAIRDYLATVKEVKNFGDAPLEMGGAGITRVFFR